MSNPDGLLRKINKASLASLLQKNVQVSEEVPVNSPMVIDDMSLVQRLKEDELTFGDDAMNLLSKAMKEGVSCNRIDVVFETIQYNTIQYNTIQ